MARHGSVYQIDEAALARLKPDLLIAQAVCDVCAVPTSLAETVAQHLGTTPRILSLDAHRVADIYAGVEAVGRAAGAEAHAVRRAAELRQRVEAVSARVAGRRRPRVLAVEWLDPPFAPGHWTPEMVALAGGENLVGEAGRPSRQVSWPDLSGLDPDVLLVMPCGYDLARSLEDAAAFAEQLGAVAPRALEQGRAYVVDGSAYFNRSGPRMVDGVEILGALLHPSVFPDQRLEGRAQEWPGLASYTDRKE
jgi:iron complex transport system substrate-binding protein